jgi:hypothetical protein
MSDNFLPPFKAVCQRMTFLKVNGKTRVNASHDDFIDLVKLFLRGTTFDETWYLEKYPDVAEAVKAGSFESGRQHFINVGYFEGRRPRSFDVDEKWYVAQYPDVAEGIGRGNIKSARQHFNDHGYDEGRLPGKA